ncbi:MAG: hypothetical protein Kow0090_21940 [Myxococcota bacterium]
MVKKNLRVIALSFSMLLLFPACGGEEGNGDGGKAEVIPGKKATIVIKVVTPPNQSLGSKPATVRIVLDGIPQSPLEVTVEYGERIEQSFTATPGAGLTVTVEVLDIKGDVIMRGKSAVFDLSENEQKEISILISETGKYFSLEETWDPAGFGHTATDIGNGRVLLIGGAERAENSQSIIKPAGKISTPALYDHSTLRFCSAGDKDCKAVSDDLAKRAFHTATLLDDGTIFVFGGYSEDGALRADPAIFDPEKEKWEGIEDSNIPSPRAGHSATRLTDESLKGKVLIAGGVLESGEVSKEAFLFDPRNRSFEKIEDMQWARAFHTETDLQNALGEVLITGGFSEEALPSTKVELFRASEVGQRVAKFIKLEIASPDYKAELETGRYYHSAARLINGSVIICGGKGADGPLATCELYDPTIGEIGALVRVVAAANMKFPRYGLALSLLDDGAVLITGGVTSNGGVDTVIGSSELFVSSDIAQTSALEGTFFAAEDGVERAFHRATLLRDGRVLLTGGIKSLPGSSQNVISVYTPE